MVYSAGGGAGRGQPEGWFVIPHDILPGEFAFSGAAGDVTPDSFRMRPNSVWGNYDFRITRRGPADEPTADLKLMCDTSGKTWDSTPAASRSRADNVRCSEPRYHGWSGTTRFVCDKLGVDIPGDSGQ